MVKAEELLCITIANNHTLWNGQRKFSLILADGGGVWVAKKSDLYFLYDSTLRCGLFYSKVSINF